MPKPIESQANAALNKRVEQIDSNIEQQLAVIRQQALTQTLAPEKPKAWWLTGATLATALSALLIAVVLFPQWQEANMQNSITTMLAQNEMAEDPELLDDMEFIYWLSQEHEQALL